MALNFERASRFELKANSTNAKVLSQFEAANGKLQTFFILVCVAKTLWFDTIPNGPEGQIPGECIDLKAEVAIGSYHIKKLQDMQ